MMNKQELLEAVKGLETHVRYDKNNQVLAAFLYDPVISRKEVLNLVNKLDESKKVVLRPDLYEYLNTLTVNNYSLFGVLSDFQNDYKMGNKLVHNYVNELGYAELFQLLAAAYINGCDAKVKLYYIEIPRFSGGERQFVTQVSGGYTTESFNEKSKQKFTEEELEKIPELYRQYAKEVDDEE